MDDINSSFADAITRSDSSHINDILDRCPSWDSIDMQKLEEIALSVDTPVAYYILGKIYNYCGDSPNYERECYWYKKAADMGHPTAQWYMADLFKYGCDDIEWLKADAQKSFNYYQLSAEQGNEMSLLRLGKMYFYGLPPVARDTIKAMEYASLYHILFIHDGSLRKNKDSETAKSVKDFQCHFTTMQKTIKDRNVEIIKLKRYITELEARPDGRIFIEAQDDFNKQLRLQVQ